MSNETGYVYEVCKGEELSASDLRQEMEAALVRGETVETARIPWVLPLRVRRDEDSGRIVINYQSADALYLPDIGRIGIAWGAAADWADAASLAEGIRIYCEDPDLFASLN